MPWQKGESGNPRGRPEGSRNAFSERFVKEFSRQFELYGAEAIERVFRDDPAQALRIAATLVPKGVDVRLASTSEHQHLVVHVDAELGDLLQRGREVPAALAEPEDVGRLV